MSVSGCGGVCRKGPVSRDHAPDKVNGTDIRITEADRPLTCGFPFVEPPSGRPDSHSHSDVRASLAARCVSGRCHGAGMTIAVAELLAYFRSAWGADTCYPDSRDDWTPQNPARDQCGMTALVVQDILGGDLVIGEVQVGGIQVGHHYWNRLSDGSEVDLTADQFRPDEEVVAGRCVARPPDAPRRHREQYELLRRRVLEALAAEARPE